jgi:hypothetical protein
VDQRRNRIATTSEDGSTGPSYRAPLMKNVGVPFTPLRTPLKELVPIAGAIAVSSHWKLDGSPSARSAVSQRPEQCNEASEWDT